MKRILFIFLTLNLLLVGCTKQNKEDELINNVNKEENQITDNENNVDSNNKQESIINDDQKDTSNKEPKKEESNNKKEDKQEDKKEENKESNKTEKKEETQQESNKEEIHSHSWQTTVIEATCMSEGYTLEECVCGEIKKSNITPPKDHEWLEFVVVKEATTTEPGKEEAKCKHCNTIGVREIPKVMQSAAVLIQNVYTLVNQERTAAGLSTLKLHSEYQSLANTRVDEIKQSFSHQRLDGRDFWTVFEDAGVNQFVGMGENIAYGYRDAESVMDAWMNSTGHRANILDADFTGIIIGVKDGYWVQLFVME